MTELTPMDEKLLALAQDGKSGQEMAAITGLPAAKALIRVREILRDRDIWTEVERRALLMDDLYDLKRQVQEQNKGVDWLTDKQIIALSKVIRDIDEVMEKQGKINADLINKVSAAQSASMLRLINNGFKRALTTLAQQYPDLPRGELQAAFNQGLQEAADLVE